MQKEAQSNINTQAQPRKQGNAYALVDGKQLEDDVHGEIDALFMKVLRNAAHDGRRESRATRGKDRADHRAILVERRHIRRLHRARAY